ncbi:hypothetical protein GIB67_003368 [Kingdonia uniflora]|uniref:Cation/H+ exchanger domain-containing protein n=1 Tax=Kingdonia uniflora TaxID=39325 RepID=A0A7J7P963_9MAGN|nr:hypothetical protein GIB67_003368 [Kingdonia uniflora]
MDLPTPVSPTTPGEMLINGYRHVCRPAGKSFHKGIFYGDSPFDYSYSRVLCELSLLIVITRTIQLILKPLKQPRVVSEIIGGIIIGPSVMGRNKTFATTVFPEKGVPILETLMVVGMMYFLFITAVKMDTSMIWAEKKSVVISLYGVFLSSVTIMAIGLLLRNKLDKSYASSIKNLGALAASVSMTAFPVLHPILSELKLLNSDVGRLAMSTAMIGDVAGYHALIIFDAIRHDHIMSMTTLWYLLSVFGLMALIGCVLRPAALWIIRQTPESKQVDEFYINCILLAVLVLGFLSDMIGAPAVYGAMMFGLAIPDGPPLGSALVDRSEAVIMELLLPFMYAFIGVNTDIFSLTDWSTLRPFILIVVLGYFAKFLGTVLPSLYFDTPIRDAISLGLTMSLRGQAELSTIRHWLNWKMVNTPYFTVMMLATVFVTAVATPLLKVLQKSAKPYIISKRRTVQHRQSNTEVRIVACVHNEGNVPALINLLEASHSKENPISVYALHLVELIGRASPMFIAHDKRNRCSRYAPSNAIVSAFKIYERTSGDHGTIHMYTTVSPYETMYQDICRLALETKASLLLVPFHNGQKVASRQLQSAYHVVRMMNSRILTRAPCSVGIFVDRGRSNLVSSSSNRKLYRVAILFMGGADSREALAYASRMAGKLTVTLSVARFFAIDNMVDDKMDRKLDDEVVAKFKGKHLLNIHVGYREWVVTDGEETISAIRAMNDEKYDLWIVGKHQGINPTLLEGLVEWSENLELGIIGDLLSSPDFGGKASVLIVQQQVLRSTSMFKGFETP